MDKYSLEESKDDVLTQGSTYQEYGDFSQVDVTETKLGKDSMQGKLQSIFEKMPLNRKTSVFIASALIAVMLFLGFIMLSGNNEDKTIPDVTSTPTPTSIVSYYTPTPTSAASVWFTDEERYELRLVGYTGWEIEEFAENEMLSTVLIESAKARRQAQLEEEMKPYIDSQSEEYKELAATTWVGLDELEVDNNTDSYRYRTRTANLDYEKIIPKGKQLFIKIYLEDGSYCFMQISPEDWLELEEVGNIVVTISYIIMGNDMEVITDIEEKDLY